MKTMILVHASCHGGWCWERVTPLLEARGYRVLAPDLPEPAPGEAAPARYWGHFIAGMAEQAAGGGPVVLIGHSRGGMVISAAAEEVPDAVTQLIYLTGALIRDGDTLASVWAEYFGEMAGRIEPDESSTHFFFGREMYRHVFCPHADPEIAAWAFRQLRPETIAVMSEPQCVSEARYGSVPRAYIETTADQLLPIDFQQFMYERLPCDPILSLPSDHCPFLSMPERLADTLAAAAG